jgi:apolipoprotein N-acyltransferase
LGLCFPMILILLYRRLGTPFTIAILIGSSFLTHIRFHRPLADPHIVAVNTAFGGAAQQDPLGATLQAQEHEVQATALAHPNTLIVYPESVIPTWTPVNDLRWTSTFTRLKAQHTGVLIGTTIPIPYSHANRNVLLSRGFTERLSYVQRVPVPLGMWRISDGNLGFPLMLRYPATIRIWDHRAGVLICYEQLIVWPVLQTLSRHPDMLLAPSNLYWARGTNIPPIEHVCAQDWADLWAVPLYEAINE